MTLAGVTSWPSRFNQWAEQPYTVRSGSFSTRFCFMATNCFLVVCNNTRHFTFVLFSSFFNGILSYRCAVGGCLLISSCIDGWHEVRVAFTLWTGSNYWCVVNVTPSVLNEDNIFTLQIFWNLRGDFLWTWSSKWPPMSLQFGGWYPGRSIWMVSFQTGWSAVLKGRLQAKNSLIICSSNCLDLDCSVDRLYTFMLVWNILFLADGSAVEESGILEDGYSGVSSTGSVLFCSAWSLGALALTTVL